MAKLTDTKIRALVRAQKAVAGVSDGDGLTFTLSAAGTASWVLRYRIGGRARELTLGNYPDVSLLAARRLAKAARVKVDQGCDVAAEKRKEIAAVAHAKRRQSFGMLAEEWFRRTVEGRVKHPKVVWRALQRYVQPIIGTTPADEVTPADIDRVLEGALKAAARTTANDLLHYLKSIGAYGVKRRLLASNPAMNFNLSDAGGEEKPRTRKLTREELAELFRAMQATPNLGRPNYLAFMLLLATCVRKGELVRSKWSEFDLETGVWHLAGERTKTGESVDIPLAPAVVNWLKELRGFAAGSEYVLPARIFRKGQPCISPDTLNVALKRVRHGLEHFTIHDMRRTARTQLAVLGVPTEVAERALNHKLRGVEGTYNQHDYFDERRDALAVWGDLLVSLESGADRSVIPLAERR
ncbi:MAG: tyrosine-type recombinase/integrase, partial [Gammaproteobacteria bacterium]|nr:tyrosine-type recombinase/integrase [Gammaproteobacteria bacterium]